MGWSGGGEQARDRLAEVVKLLLRALMSGIGKPILPLGRVLSHVPRDWILGSFALFGMLVGTMQANF